MTLLEMALLTQAQTPKSRSDLVTDALIVVGSGPGDIQVAQRNLDSLLLRGLVTKDKEKFTWTPKGIRALSDAFGLVEQLRHQARVGRFVVSR